LKAIMTEWGRTDADYLTRVRHLDGSLSEGLNGLFFLKATTVHDNGKIDSIFGGPRSVVDWFFAGITDVIGGKRSSEVLTTIS